MATNKYLRHFEFTQGKSNKFWEVEIDKDIDYVATIRWGRIGTAGQAQITNFATLATATYFAEGRCNEKLLKGYRETATLPKNLKATRTIASDAIDAFWEERTAKKKTNIPAIIPPVISPVVITPSNIKPKRKVTI